MEEAPCYKRDLPDTQVHIIGCSGIFQIIGGEFIEQVVACRIRMVKAIVVKKRISVRPCSV